MPTRRFVDPNKVGRTRPKGTGSEYAGMRDQDWRCSSCSNPKPIRGNIKICPNCGNPKDRTEKYEAPPIDRAYLTSNEIKDRGVERGHGQDEVCPYCQSHVTTKTEVCPNCQGTIKNVFRAERVCPNCKRETNDIGCAACGSPTVSKLTTASPKQPSTQSATHGSHESGSVVNKQYLVYAGIIGLLALLIFGLISIFRPHDEIASVSSNSWSCSVPLQEYQYNFHSDWSLPADADLITSYEKFHYNDKVEDGYEEVCEDKWEVVGFHYEDVTNEVCVSQPDEYVDTTESCDIDESVCTYVDNYRSVPDVCSDVTTSEKVNDSDWVTYCSDVMQYKDVPVNDIYYEYNIWEWVSLNPLSTSGNDNLISCPVVNVTQTVRQSGNPNIDCNTQFQVGKKYYPYSPDCSSQFPAFSQGSEWLVTISGPSITEVNYVP